MLGAVKDHTSIDLAKVAGNMAQEAKVDIVKATSDDDDPVDEKYIRRTLNLASYSCGYVLACVSALSKRLSKTHDYVVALKSLIVIHRLLNDGDPIFREEITYATGHGARLLNLSDFRDEAHSSSWNHLAFARTYAMYLGQQLESILFDRKSGGGPSGSVNGGGSVYNEDRYGNRDDFRSPPRE
ncbi:putative clathrin assembly protein At2g25430 isoform X2 [Eucalyptus grandis]|nr:putative clathrin assembly protein At2g25430 isoform X2 [Eucalyptus grandis]